MHRQFSFGNLCYENAPKFSCRIRSLYSSEISWCVCAWAYFSLIAFIGSIVVVAFIVVNSVSVLSITVSVSVVSVAVVIIAVCKVFIAVLYIACPVSCKETRVRERQFTHANFFCPLRLFDCH